MAKPHALFLSAAWLLIPCIADAEDAADKAGAQWSALYTEEIGASASVAGNQDEAGRFGISLQGDDCTMAMPFFLTTSTAPGDDLEALRGKPLLIRLNWTLRDARPRGIQRQDDHYSVVVDLGKMHVGRFEALYGNGEVIAVRILDDTENYHPSFDRPYNSWNTDGMEEVLAEAQTLCLQNRRTGRNPTGCDELRGLDKLLGAMNRRRYDQYVEMTEACLAYSTEGAAETRRNALYLSANVEVLYREMGVSPRLVMQVSHALNRLAAEAGDPAAQFFQAMLFEESQANPWPQILAPDWTSMMFWLHHSASQEYASAHYVLALKIIRQESPPPIHQLEGAYQALLLAPRLSTSPEIGAKMAETAAKLMPGLQEFIGADRMAELETQIDQYDFSALVPVLTKDQIE